MSAAETVRPPFAYFGGKQRIARRIAGLLPTHEHYVEPYCGGLSVLAAKAPSRMETVNDLDGHIMTFWRVLRDRPDDLIRACALTPHARAEHVASRDLEGLDELEHARRVWVALAQGRSGQLRRTGWRHFITAAGSSIGMPGYLDAYIERMATLAERLHHVSLECRPALDIIERFGNKADVLLYVDPPYPANVRGPRGSHSYRLEMHHDRDHIDLAHALRACTAAVVISSYDGDLYRTLYDGWHQHALPASTGQTSGDRSRTEVLWSNRPLAPARAR